MGSPESYCLNCENELNESDEFCCHCGQNRQNYALEIKEVGAQIFVTIFNMDNSFFRTALLLITPWKLTRYFVAGKRIPFFHPGRMFIVLLFLLFSILTIFKKESLEIHIGEDYFISAEDYLLKDSLDKLAENLNLSTLQKQNVYAKIFRDKKIPNDTMIFEPFLVMNTSINQNPILLKEILTLPLDTLYKNYKIDGFWEKLYLAQSIKWYKNNNDFFSYFIKNILWTIPCSLIILASFMMILYFRHKYYYIEHLVFLMHLHATIFAFFILLILLTNFFSDIKPEVIQALILVFPTGISLLSFIRYYGQNFFKTLIKFVAMLLIYTLTLIIGGVLILLLSVFLF